jgi:hypothetical protein
MPMWRPAGPETPLRAPLQVSPPQRSSRRNRLANQRASGNAREDQGWRAREPLPAAQAADRAGIRTDQTGPRLPPVPAARFEKPRAEWAIVCTVHNLLKLALRRNLSERLPIAA